MKSPILRIFLLLILCTIVAIFSFNAGVQFSERDSKPTEFPGVEPSDQADLVRAAFPGLDVADVDSRHPRGRRAFATTKGARAPIINDQSALAVDGPVFDDTSSLLFNVHEKFKVKSRMAGGFFYTPPHDGMALLRNETASKAEPVNTHLAKIINSHSITTSLLYSFSPDVERRVATMFPDPMKENVFFANSPALYWDRDFNNGQGRLVVIMRIWLDRERYEDKNNWPKNAFLDNYFYARTYDNEFTPLDPGHIMGIPTNGGSTVGDGPIEPRLFPAFNRSNLFVSFNTGMNGLNYKAMDYTLIWDYRQNKINYPVIHGFSPMLDNPDEGFPRDKHWAAFNMPNNGGASSNPTIHFVHNLEPLRVLECDSAYQCKIVYAAGTAKENIFDDLKHHLRGGTPFVHYTGPYYFGFGHVTLFKKRTSDTRRYYTTNIILLKADPSANPPYRIVFVSDPLKLARDLLNSVPIVRYMYIEDPFIFPVGLLLENRDTAVLGVHINDHTAILVRIRGIEALLKDVIATDELPAERWTQPSQPNSSTHKWLRDGAKIGPNHFSRLLAEEESGAQFEFSAGD